MYINDYFVEIFFFTNRVFFCIDVVLFVLKIRVLLCLDEGEEPTPKLCC